MFLPPLLWSSFFFSVSSRSSVPFFYIHTAALDCGAIYKCMYVRQTSDLPRMFAWDGGWMGWMPLYWALQPKGSACPTHQTRMRERDETRREEKARHEKRKECLRGDGNSHFHIWISIDQPRNESKLHPFSVIYDTSEWVSPNKLPLLGDPDPELICIEFVHCFSFSFFVPSMSVPRYSSIDTTTIIIAVVRMYVYSRSLFFCVVCVWGVSVSWAGGGQTRRRH